MSSLYYRARSGFTLVELLVAMAIFLVASMGLLPLLLSNMQLNHNNALHSRAQRLAGEAMASLQALEYPRLLAVDAQPRRYGAIELQREVDIDTPRSGQVRITVTAHWQQRGRVHRYQLQALRAAP